MIALNSLVSASPLNSVFVRWLFGGVVRETETTKSVPEGLIQDEMKYCSDMA